MITTRRTFERQRVWPPVLARIGPASALEVLDLSEGGAGVLSSEPLTEGETIRLQIPLPGQESTAPASGLAEATGETVWAAKTGRAGIRFMDVPVDSRSLLQEWIRRRASEKPPSESEAVPPAALSGEQARPSARFAHPWVIVAAAIVLGMAGGIWLATREEPLGEKAVASTPLTQKPPQAPVSAAPVQEKTGIAIPETPPVKPAEDQLQGKGGVSSTAPQQPPGAPIAAAPVQAKTGPAIPELPEVKPRSDGPESRSPSITLPSVQAMRFSHQPGLTRVEIDLGTSILLRHGRLHKPERIYFDVRDSHREKGIVRRFQEQKVGDLNDAVLTGVRVAPLRSGDVRVVLDLNRSCEYAHRLSSNPASSLIVELQESSASGGEAPKPQ